MGSQGIEIRRRAVVAFVLPLVVVSAMAGCDLIGIPVPDVGSLATYNIADLVALEQEQADLPGGVHHFYFSYDDSASTASVELAKYELNHSALPSATLARPWEFLNYEAFDPALPESTGLFEVSFGLVERDPLTGNGKEYKLGVYVASPEITTAGRQNAVITFIVDVSGSMDSNTTRVEEQIVTRMELVKYGLNKLVNLSLKDSDVVNLVSFSTSASTVFQSKRIPEDQSYIIAQIDQLDASGSTNLAQGIQQGYAVAQATYESDKLNRVVIVTDADANTGEIDPTVVSRETVINEQEGIYFSGVGIGADFNEQFLNELTEAGKGAYFSLLTKTDAVRVFVDRFIALLTVAARSVRFRLDYPESMVHDTTASEESSVEAQDVQPTNFSYNTSQYFFEGFHTASESAHPDEEYVLTIHFEDPETGVAQTETSTKKVSEIVGRQQANIASAEAIFLFTQLIGGTMQWESVEQILQTYYSGHSAPVFDEYVDLMNRYVSLSE